MKKQNYSQLFIFVSCALLCAWVFGLSGCALSSSTNITTTTDDGFSETFDPSSGSTTLTHKDLLVNEWSGYNLRNSNPAIRNKGDLHLQVSIVTTENNSYGMGLRFICRKDTWSTLNKVTLYTPSDVSAENRLIIEKFHSRGDSYTTPLTLKEIEKIKKILQYDDATIRFDFPRDDTDCLINKKVKNAIYATFEKFEQLRKTKNTSASVPSEPSEKAQSETNEVQPISDQIPNN